MEVCPIDPDLLEDPETSSYLPQSAVETARHGTNHLYLNILARLLLVPKYTATIFRSYGQLLVELVNRWDHFQDIPAVKKLAAIARLLHPAPYLAIYAEELLFAPTSRDSDDSRRVRALRQGATTDLAEIGKEELRELLLALLRLLKFDNATFAKAVSASRLRLLVDHWDYSIRYLAVQVLCLYLHAADAATQALMRKYYLDESIKGPWEGKHIDYLFLP